MLFKLLSRIDRSTFFNYVISLTCKGDIAEKIEALDIDVQSLGMRRGIPDPRGIWNLRGLIREIRPNIVQTWMYHADLIGGLAAKGAGKIPVIWNIRHSNLDSKDNKKITFWTAKACALLSGVIPENIVCCSEASRRVHSEIGYQRNKMLIIPNGFDLEIFGPNKDARDVLRAELGIGRDALLVGMAARFNPQKDHYTLIQAVSILKKQGLQFCIILCGKDINWDNAQLKNWIKEAELEDRFFLLGPRNDMPSITAALDIAVLSSAHGEGLPNVLGEAMACAVPCVATNVGDAAELVSNTGRVVPPRNPKALAEAMSELLDMKPEDRAILSERARKRVEDKFELGRIVDRYEKLYKGTLGIN